MGTLLLAKHHKAVEMKYEGHSLSDVSKETGLKESTLGSYFSTGGLLDIPFQEYEMNQNKIREKQARNLFKSSVLGATQVILTSMKRAFASGNDKLALDLAKEVLDRAGLVKVNVSEITNKDDREPMTYEQLISELKREGIDQRSGTRIRKTKNNKKE